VSHSAGGGLAGDWRGRSQAAGEAERRLIRKEKQPCAPHGAAPSSTEGQIVREEQEVLVGKTKELWRLVWNSSPKPACTPDDCIGGWSTCPCDDFAYGERGDLDLIRLVGVRVVERFPITPFFGEQITDWGRVAILARWEVQESEWETMGADWGALMATIHARPNVKIMQLRDYDHDGRSTEFVLQTATEPCGKREGIVIGVSRDRPRLHAFGTVEHPDDPLLLRIDHWIALADSSVPMTRIEWQCYDHGSDTEDEVELRTDGNGTHATTRSYACEKDGTRGRLLTTLVR
jgi:hypothetical protein